MASMEDIWRNALPAGTEILAADTELGREVSWVLVLKPRPPALDAPRGDELVLLSTRTLQVLDPQMGLARALQSLAREVAGVAVHGAVPGDAVDAARRMSLPLFQLPATAVVPDVEREVLRFLSDQRSEWYRRKDSILHDLTALAVQGRGLAAIAQQMGELSGQAVLFEDERGDVLALHLPPGFRDETAELVHAFVEGRVSIPEAVPASSRQSLGRDDERMGDRIARLVIPVKVKDLTGVTVSLLGPARVLDAQARQVLEAGATAAAIELAREHAVQETVHRIQGDLVSDLIYGDVDSRALERRAMRLGYDLDTRRVAMVLCPIPEASPPDAAGAEVIEALRRRVTRVLIGYDVQAPLHLDGSLLTIFYPLQEDLAPPALKRLAGRLCTDVADATRHHRLLIGISRVRAGTDSFRSCFEEGRRAVELSRAFAPDRSITCFEELGVYRLLLAVRDRHEMEEFYGDMLGRLARYDVEKNADLLRTLDTYLRSNNALEVAERLSLHRNTLVYRLRRIREISGLDLDDPETRFALHLALRVGEALRLTTRPGS